MGLFFKDKAFDFETMRTLNYYNYQGAEIGEVLSVSKKIEEENFVSWFENWQKLAQTVENLGQASLDKNHKVSAREAFLRASNYYRTAEFFMENSEPKRIACYQKSVQTFEEAMKLFSVTCKKVAIPFEDYNMHGYLYVTAKEAPILIFIGGYDSTAEELYFAGAAAAIKRGYNVLIFDGPGQGEALRMQGKAGRFDYEKPISAAIDFLETEKDVDTAKFIGLMGMSLGGYYAARASAFEPRIDACILFDVFTNVWQSILQKTPMLEKLTSATPEMRKVMSTQADANTRWLIQNGLWVFGCSDLPELVAEVQKYNLEPVAAQIKCPMLLLFGTQDHFVNEAQLESLKSSLTCDYQDYIFDEELGAQEHCQEGNQSYASQVIFDWLDEKKEEKIESI